jgi:hypothetical protein
VNRALILFRQGLHYRRDAFAAGLEAAGYRPVAQLPNPKPGDVLVIWNRMGEGHSRARMFEAAKAKVLVVENGYLGKEFRGEQWFAMARNHHNGAGYWPRGMGPERWDSWGIQLAPWREPEGECVILAQRGIGEPGLRAPDGWLNLAVSTTKGRIRRHPGTNKDGPSLEEDLRNASSVATWSSGAALKALVMGIPVFYGMPRWIGAGASARLDRFGHFSLVDDRSRLAMFRQLAWAQWSMTEIENGSAFKAVLA